MKLYFHRAPVFAIAVVTCSLPIAACHAAPKQKPATKLIAKIKKPAPSVPSAPAGDGADDQEARVEAPVNLKRPIKPNVVVTKVDVAATSTSNDGPPPTPGVLINNVVRNDSESKETLQLAQDGKALLPIVISAKASESTQALAKEVAELLKHISGATFEVKTGDGTSGIVIGTLKEFPDSSLDKALAIRNGFDGREAFAIRTREKKVVLLGATDVGASHAVWRMMEVLGYRHFFPHSAWEVIPSTPDLKWNRDITDRPQMLNRTIWFEAGSGTAQAEKNYQNWKRHNQVAESLKVNIGGGGLNGPFTKEIMDAHPEYAAARIQADGTLKSDFSGYQLELSNPAVRKIIVDAAVQAFKDNPSLDMVNLDPADTNAYSESPESLALCSVSDAVFGLLNEAARAVEKAFPGQHKMVGVLSYNSTFDPPTFKLEPNVHVQLSPIGYGNKYGSDERAKLWAQRSSNLGSYEYYSVWAWSTDQLPGSYTNGVRGSQKHIRDDLIATGRLTMSAESTSSWGSNGRGYYVAQKLMWNPNLDLDALLDDFYTNAFGPGAEDMRKYYDRLDPDNVPLISSSVIGQLLRDVDNASKAAKDRPDVQARLDQLKVYLRYVEMRWRRDSEGIAVDGEEIMIPLYRGREYAMTAWSMIMQSWGGDRPIVAPYTHEEIETKFQEGLAHYLPKIRDDLQPRIKFSEDLVPVKWPNTPKFLEPEHGHEYQGSMKYAFYSLKGEPLEFNTWVGDAWGYRTSFTITDAEGKVIVTVKPEPKSNTLHKIEVPEAGLYYLNFSDPGAYWSFYAKPSQIASIVVLPEVTGARSPNLLKPMCFYVPKGTKVLEYFATTGNNIHAPDGTQLNEKQTVNNWVSIPVPKGADGKLWTIGGMAFGKFYFSNIPSYVASSAESLLVPREVAEKDGLEIR